MKDPQMPMWQRWAQFRLSVVGELLICPPPKGQLQHDIGLLAPKTYQHPIEPNRQISIGSSTIVKPQNHQNQWVLQRWTREKFLSLVYRAIPHNCKDEPGDRGLFFMIKKQITS